MKNTAFAGALTTIALCGIVFGLTCVSKNMLTQRKAIIGSESLAESTSDSTLDDWKPTAFTHRFTEKNTIFSIDFPKLKSVESGLGRLCDLGNGTGVSVGTYSDTYLAFCGEAAKPENIAALKEIPTIYASPIALSFDRETKEDCALGDEMAGALTIDSIAEPVELNGYEVCRFTATYTYTGRSDGIGYSCPVIGYVLQLHQNSYPLYVAAIDTTSSPDIGTIDSLALTCISSLHE